MRHFICSSYIVDRLNKQLRVEIVYVRNWIGFTYERYVIWNAIAVQYIQFLYVTVRYLNAIHTNAYILSFAFSSKSFWIFLNIFFFWIFQSMFNRTKKSFHWIHSTCTDMNKRSVYMTYTVLVSEYCLLMYEFVLQQNACIPTQCILCNTYKYVCVYGRSYRIDLKRSSKYAIWWGVNVKPVLLCVNFR